MSVDFSIFSRLGIVYVRYSGFAWLDDSFAAFARYAQHPDYRPGQRQLVDLSGVAGFENDYAKLLALQARKADNFTGHESQTLLVYYAPTRVAYDMAMLIRRSWEGVEGMVIRVAETERQVLELLGQPEESIADLMEKAG
ncbi:hypothetical protein OG2516_03023 [Oceanicola granulosus HTCC2516]|uniref:Uncharacterized protein n=1 Tax=Oceanicola granulosus (strain ATCC BAA-861 / DSM 15982 / KCTC 12143 / HTCC2516) TaxID=314256 RepID=Q2CA20_OCEGH|nr:hypothetical protein [Oceanicola granulosus]EAR49517.1 hypothetical protein OG2516_03023 [Oceanicola granulosus HTCC2516]